MGDKAHVTNGGGRPWRILLDVDGVLADFYGGACRVHGVSRESLPVGQWEMRHGMGISEAAFWEPLDNYDFWVGLQKYPWADSLVACMKTVADVTFCTTPSVSSDCHKAKMDWIRKHFGDDAKVMLGSQKYLMAAPRHILIDDYHANVDKFIAEGGKAILFPARWNKLHAVQKDNVDHTIDILSAIIQESTTPPPIFPEGASERHEYPVFTGLLAYFPRACAAVANVSFIGNEQHQPGEPMHWAKEKSIGTGDQVVRHTMQGVLEGSAYHLAQAAWRALELLERKLCGMPPFGDQRSV